MIVVLGRITLTPVQTAHVKYRCVLASTRPSYTCACVPGVDSGLKNSSPCSMAALSNDCHKSLRGTIGGSRQHVLVMQ